MGPAARLSHGGAELCGRTLATGQENGTWTAAATRAKIAHDPQKRVTALPWLTNAKRLRGDHVAKKDADGSGSGRERFAGVRTNALDHRTQAVGTLRRQVLAKAELVEDLDRVGVQNVLRRPAGIKRQQDRDQSAHDVGVTVAAIFQHRAVAAAALDPLRQPHLAD